MDTPHGLSLDELVTLAKDKIKWRLAIPGLVQKATLDEQKETEKEINELEARIKQQQQQQAEGQYDDQSMDYSVLFAQTSSMALLPNPYGQTCPGGKLPPGLLQQLNAQFPNTNPPTISSATTPTISPQPPSQTTNTTPLLPLPTSPLQRQPNQTTPLLPTPTTPLLLEFDTIDSGALPPLK